MDTDTIELKVKARMLGKVLADMASDEEFQEDVAFLVVESFARNLGVEVRKPRGDEVPDRVRLPIARLGAERLEFGVHAHKVFDDVPLDYLDWLCGRSEETAKKIKQYLNHPELPARRQGESFGD